MTEASETEAVETAYHEGLERLQGYVDFHKIAGQFQLHDSVHLEISLRESSGIIYPYIQSWKGDDKARLYNVPEAYAQILDAVSRTPEYTMDNVRSSNSTPPLIVARIFETCSDAILQPILDFCDNELL